MKYILLFIGVLVATVVLTWPQAKPQIRGDEQFEALLIQSLHKHSDYIATLNGDFEFEIYRAAFNNRAKEIEQYLLTHDVNFYISKEEGAVMSVKGNGLWRTGIYVDEYYADYIGDWSPRTMSIVLHELSHLIFWSEDATVRVEDLARSKLPDYGDWYNLIYLYQDKQEYLRKIILP